MSTRIILLAVATHFSINWEVDKYYVMMLRKGGIEVMGKRPQGFVVGHRDLRLWSRAE